ncbi:MAG TPA: FAD-binding oxidoreductase [Candidatus Latescibacteria bacterium]|nr:FAD-binding oxidoreductase [Candidatus Handelsmanbacteria bacterium]HIL08676.1 FAD-binding oxidoreductase [Candidatus Latescibacterota bacterium]
MLEVIFAVAAFVIAAAIVRQAGPEGEDSFYDLSDGERQPHRWGYTDTHFEFVGPKLVRVTGSRYPLAGYEMPNFIPFVEDMLEVPISPDEIVAEKERQDVPASRAGKALVAVLTQALGATCVSLDDKVRLVHSHGQLSVDEIYRLLYGDSLARVVDVVLYPESEDHVRAIVRLAEEHDICLVPYGGGTNVSGALALPLDDGRVFASVDMRRMNKVVWLDEENFQACIEAGISGKELERELSARGYTSGHDPDSIELSTLGGWIATNASGMKKNRYGNIEDIVLEATLVTPAGDVETLHVTPRNSVGVQPRGLLFGSEGNFGIITKAVLKVHPKPAVCEYGALLFKTFADGVNYLKELRQTGALPASIRLVNNNEFRFGQALKPAPSALQHWKEKVQKFALLKVMGFDPLQMVACTIVMEGTADEVEHQQRTIFKLAKAHGGKSAGAANGKRGYTLTFGIAYIRDFLNQFNFLGETFETSVPWNKIHQVTQAVQEKLTEQCASHNIGGQPYLAYRVTQTYHTGVCIYFTMGFSGRGLQDPIETYHKIEHSLRQTIMDHGGSLSHHHGVGKIRQGFMRQVQSDGSIAVLQKTKQAIDPKNVFGIRNGVFTDADLG